MNATLTIARRELMGLLLSPVGYVITALFLFFCALVYFAVAPLLVGLGFAQGQPSSLRLFFEIGIWVLFVIGPAVSMRMISEEQRQGTLELLMTAPIHDRHIIAGKFAGGFGFLVIMLVPTVVFVIGLEVHGRPDYGELASGYLGLLLVGAAYLASGILASTLTGSQMLAYVTTVFFWLILLLATMVLPFLATRVEGLAQLPGQSETLVALLGVLEQAARFLAAANPLLRARGFVIGLVDTFNVVYFVSLIVVCLLAATRSLGLRRW